MFHYPFSVPHSLKKYLLSCTCNASRHISFPSTVVGEKNNSWKHGLRGSVSARHLNMLKLWRERSKWERTMKSMGGKKSKLRVRCPEKVGGKLALVKEAALLTEQVERRKEWLPSRKQEARSGVVETGHWRTLWACHSFIDGPERKLCAPPGHQCSASEASQLWHHEKGNSSNSMAAWPYLCQLRLCHCFTFFSLCGPLQRTLSPPLPSLNSPTSPQQYKTEKQRKWWPHVKDSSLFLVLVCALWVA